MIPILLNVNKSSSGNIVTLCDENLIGKKFEEGDLQLNVSERFYKGSVLPESEILATLKNAENINIVGEHSIGFCLKAKIITGRNVIRIRGIPHAIVV